MKNEFVSPYNLRRSISDLLTEKESRINSSINNLKINDVKEDKIFADTIERVKKMILLTPIVIGEGKFVDHDFEEIPLTMQQQLIGGVSRNHYHHHISFPFTGDSELISHKPNSFSFSSSDRGLIVPYSNKINVYVDLPELNPDRAVQHARTYLSMTIRFVTSNNSTVESWNIVVGQRIDEQLKNKRDELIRIFGAK